jgi:hypothetical protein
VPPPAQAGSPLTSGWVPWLVRAALVMAALFTITVGRAIHEGRSRTRLGLAAERAGALDVARLRFGEARLWRAPLFSSLFSPWADEADRHLAALPAGPRTALAGAVGSPGAAQFGRTPRPLFAWLGGLGLLLALLAAARWAATARAAWALTTLVGGVVAALALWAA